MGNSNNLKLKAEMLTRGITAHDLAVLIGISYSTVLRKLSGDSHFTVEEVLKVKQGLRLTKAKATEIFFHDSP